MGYTSSFYFLTLSLKTIPIGLSYSIWSGLGTVLVAAGANIFYKQSLSYWETLGMIFIIIGVILMSLFSKNHNL
jgi:small multidrug resistance pump